MSVSADERARAELYCQQQRNRVAFRRELEARLAGDPAVSARIREDWQPIADWNADRQLPPEPLEQELCEAESERHHADLCRRFFGADSSV